MNLLKPTFCTTNIQDTLLTYSDAFALSRCDLLIVLLAVFPASLETTSGTVAVTDLLTSTKNFSIDAHLLNRQFKSVTCWQKNIRQYDGQEQTVIWCTLYFVSIAVVLVPSLWS